MADGVNEIEGGFAERFAHWGIRLPTQSVAGRKGGHIFEAGWHIGYIWGEQDGEEYLEVLAQNRMTDDAHFRIWASGRSESLPAPVSVFAYPKDATPEEIKRRSDEHAAQYSQMTEELREKGLLPPSGQNLPSLDINELLRSGKMPDKGTASEE
ncbi:hypothetical protein AYO39_00165 [Actinobacteria bacterium SCGC AG-212-D09]|nr:hypothetical protein AYO39_00165 [Actinobacteria bacterium SCGC AG-212-D09]